MKLLTRDKFRESVFERDDFHCVNCLQYFGHWDTQAEIDKHISAHHIIERRLWLDGGYYINNGVTLCDPCHLMAESTELSCEEIREKAKIKNLVLPEDFYRDFRYDKWGNILDHNGRNLPGPLFWDTSVKKIMGDRQKSFCKYIKYPRTYHLPWSQPGRESDRYLQDIKSFEEQQVIITEKRDGENATLYDDYYHARSLDGRHHPSRSWIKNFHAKIAHYIPEDM